MAIPTVYTSADSGAPVISASAGAALAVLRACLVDGYGSKAPAGWTEEFTGTNVAVFRNSVADGGTGCYVRVDDTAASGTASPAIRTYSAMSDIDTGDAPTGIVYGVKAPGTAPYSWVVVATSKAWWLIAWSTPGSGSVHRGFLGAGDAIPAAPGDVYRYFALGKTSTGTVSVTGPFAASTVAWGGTQQGLSLGRTYDGLSGPLWAQVLMPNVSGTSNYIGGPAFPALPSPNAADAAGIPAYITNSEPSPVIRGVLPGMVIPLFDTTAYEAGDTVPATPLRAGSVTILAKNRTTGSGTPAGGVLIETALDWGD